jgi:hypothetical protein
MMGGETAQNTQSIDNNKEYCIVLHLVGYTWKNTVTMHGPMNVKQQNLYMKGDRKLLTGNYILKNYK